ATTSPAATVSPSRRGSSRTAAGRRAARVALCRAATTAGTVVSPAPDRSTRAVLTGRGGRWGAEGAAGRAFSPPQAASAASAAVINKNLFLMAFLLQPPA